MLKNQTNIAEVESEYSKYMNIIKSKIRLGQYPFENEKLNANYGISVCENVVTVSFKDYYLNLPWEYFTDYEQYYINCNVNPKKDSIKLIKEKLNLC